MAEQVPRAHEEMYREWQLGSPARCTVGRAMPFGCRLGNERRVGQAPPRVVGHGRSSDVAPATV